LLPAGDSPQRSRIRASSSFDVHVLDETHDDARAAEALDELEQRVIVLAALDDRVDLDRQPGALRGVDALEHHAELAAAAVHLAEYLLVEAVEAHGDTPEPCLFERRCVLGQARAVGRDRNVLDTAELGEARNDLDDVAAQQRLSAREAQLLDTEVHEDAGHAFDLARREPMGARQEFVILAVELGGHAIRATIVAAVDDRDAEIAQGPS
jgi:hypothetical protein